MIFSAKTKVGGFASKFLNDVEVIDGDTILVTDSSTNYDRRRFLHVLVCQDISNKLIQKITFKNGHTHVCCALNQNSNSLYTITSCTENDTFS